MTFRTTKMKTLLRFFPLLLVGALFSSCQVAHPLPVAGTFQRSGRITLEVATSKTTYKAGEMLSFTVRPSEDCHLAAWIVGADQKVMALYPNPHDFGRIFKKGDMATLPGKGPFRFKITPPEGRELLVVAASKRPITADSAPTPEAWLKGVSVESTDGEVRGEARVVYEVVR